MNRKHVTNECPYFEEERCKLKNLLGVGLGEDLEDRIIRVYYSMKEEDEKRADWIIARDKEYFCKSS